MNKIRNAVVSNGLCALTILGGLLLTACGSTVGGGGTGGSGTTSTGSGGSGGGSGGSGSATLIFSVGTTGLNPWGIAVDATNVYFTDAQGPHGAVMKVPLDGSPASPLATMEDLPSAIAVDATDVYFTAADALRKVPIAGGTAATIAPAGDAGYASIAVDATNVYWTNYVSDGSTMLLPKAGGTPTVVDSGDEYPSGIALAGGSNLLGVAGGRHHQVRAHRRRRRDRGGLRPERAPLGPGHGRHRRLLDHRG
ncbi:MAG: hypothetical protein QM820_33785 [Minicystis sp.]